MHGILSKLKASEPLALTISNMSRITDFAVGDYIHCIKRGAFGVEIFRDKSDYYRFMRLLYLCNDEYIDKNFGKLESTLKMFERPTHWPSRDPLVEVISWVAMPNHFHILLREVKKGGVGKFMQRVSGSITLGYNRRYDNKGTIFQGQYKPVVVEDSDHLTNLIHYINVKNVCELYPHGGISGAIKNFDHAFSWALEYPFSSLKSVVYDLTSPILAQDRIRSIKEENQMFLDPVKFKTLARAGLVARFGE